MFKKYKIKMVDLKSVYPVKKCYQKCLHGKNKVTKYCAVFYEVRKCVLRSKLENALFLDEMKAKKAQ